MYLNDIATIPANLAGIPAMNVPNAVSSEGFRRIPDSRPGSHDLKMYEVASLVEQLSSVLRATARQQQWEEK